MECTLIIMEPMGLPIDVILFHVYRGEDNRMISRSILRTNVGYSPATRRWWAEARPRLSLCTPGLSTLREHIASSSNQVWIQMKHCKQRIHQNIQKLLVETSYFASFLSPCIYLSAVLRCGYDPCALPMCSELGAGPGPARAVRLSPLCGRCWGYFWSSSTILDSAEQIFDLK